MTSGLKRYQNANDYHFVTFSCSGRLPFLNTPERRDLFLEVLERVRRRYRMLVYGYVVMPEHVHLLVGEPEGGLLASAIQLLKQNVSRLIHERESVGAHPSKGGQGGAPTHHSDSGHGCPEFWLPRYFDLNVWSDEKFTAKLKYIHRNPTKRALVKNPEDWKWSSFRHYAFGEEGPVEIESRWTARKRWRSGLQDLAIKKNE